ncbi:MAG: rhodanese-related sulfurtransferase [Verrucomicrobia bacterium]|nr:rhodanese-related sulfurtransferase [Verrucomicrobiota bacterium]MCH8525685.1 rhodanese-related sulfurtransferase [Kiritimatiellia bacterium]
MKWTIYAFYKFFDFPDFAEAREGLLAFCEEQGICGSVLLAAEGVNGTMAGSAEAMEGLMAYLEGLAGPIEVKAAVSDEKPFRKTKVKLKSEIVHLGRPDLRPGETAVGRYVEPKDWNALIAEAGVRVIDTRNDFEVRVGTFAGAENPHTERFSEFPDYVEQALDPSRDRKVAMFCTGGIRCEKATAHLLEQGFEEVYHLKGGILKYLEEVPEAESLWRGECFVFDDRVTVNHRLEPGETECCRGCWNPLRPEDKLDPRYEAGVSCPLCFDRKSPERLAAARERERQRVLALERAAAAAGNG